MTCFYHLHQTDDEEVIGKYSEDLLRLIDENLGELNEFKDLSHRIAVALEAMSIRIDKFSKRIELLESQILQDGLTDLERKIMIIIREQAGKTLESLIDFTAPAEEMKHIANISRDEDTNAEDKTSG